MLEAHEEKMRRGGGPALEELGLFFAQTGPVHLALRKICSSFSKLQIPYAVAGAMALNAHGYRRATVDVDILLTPEGLKFTLERLDGSGYLRPSAERKHLRDTEYGVKIDFLVTGQYPGDGKPKPVAFPDPATCVFEKDGVNYLKLPTLIELKLASGMTNPGRLKDLGDVQELIRELKLKQDFGAQIHPYVREKFMELWQGVKQDTREL